jgi:hypothetical protein
MAIEEEVFLGFYHGHNWPMAQSALRPTPPVVVRRLDQPFQGHSQGHSQAGQQVATQGYSQAGQQIGTQGYSQTGQQAVTNGYPQINHQMGPQAYPQLNPQVRPQASVQHFPAHHSTQAPIHYAVQPPPIHHPVQPAPLPLPPQKSQLQQPQQPFVQPMTQPGVRRLDEDLMTFSRPASVVSSPNQLLKSGYHNPKEDSMENFNLTANQSQRVGEVDISTNLSKAYLEARSHSVDQDDGLAKASTRASSPPRADFLRGPMYPGQRSVISPNSSNLSHHSHKTFITNRISTPTTIPSTPDRSNQSQTNNNNNNNPRSHALPARPRSGNNCEETRSGRTRQRRSPNPQNNLPNTRGPVIKSTARPPTRPRSSIHPTRPGMAGKPFGYTGDRFTCNRCNNVFASPERLRIHQENCRGHGCKKCSLVFCTTSQRDLHQSRCGNKTTTNAAPVACKLCDRLYATPEACERHILTCGTNQTIRRTGGKKRSVDKFGSLKCNRCGAFFEQLSKWHIHNRKCLGGRIMPDLSRGLEDNDSGKSEKNLRVHDTGVIKSVINHSVQNQDAAVLVDTATTSSNSKFQTYIT